MSLAIAAVATGLAAQVTGVPQYLQQKKGLEAQRAAQYQAAAQARAQAAAAERDFNRLNQKRPNLAGMMEGNAPAAGAAGGTMLTGPQGVDMTSARLGRTSLLGS